MNTNAQLGIVVTAVDRASAVLASVDRNTRRLANTFDSFKGRLTNAFQYHVIYRSLNLLEAGIGAVARAIPGLVNRGKEWLDTVDDISDATGLSARRASEYAAIQQQLGGSTDSFARSLAFMGRTVVTNEGAFKRFGIRTRDQNGDLLDADRLFENVRRKTSALGSSQRTTAIATQLLGRSSRDLLDLLTLSDSAYARAAASARANGLVVSDAAVAAQEAWKRARASLDAAITGTGAQVAAAVAPALTGLVNGITRFVQRNLAQISSFVVSVVATVTGLLGGLFGADLGLVRLEQHRPTFREWLRDVRQVPAATDRSTGAIARNTAAIDRRIAAIDRELAAMDRSDRANDYRRQLAELRTDVSRARRELSDILSDSTFASGMSEAEAELARQAQQRKVADARKGVRDARRAEADAERKHARDQRRQALQDQREALQRQVSAQRSAGRQMVQATTQTMAELRRQYRSLFGGGGGGKGELEERLEGVAESALKGGRRIADAINDALFGAKTTEVRNGNFTVTVRQGGLIEHLRNLAEGIGRLVGIIAPNTDALLAVAAVIGALKAGQFLTGLLPGAATGAGAGILAGGGGALIAGLLASEGVKGLIKGVVPSTSNSRRISGAHPFGNSFWGGEGPDALVAGWIEQFLPGWLVGTDKGGGLAAGMMAKSAGFGAARGRRGPAAGRGAAADPLAFLLSKGSSHMDPWTWMPGLGAGPGAGMADPLIQFRRWLGPYSPLVTGVREGADNAGAGASYAAETAGNTGPLADDDLGVTNPKFGLVDRWGAGKMPIKAGKGDIPVPSVNVKAVARAASNRAYDLSINAALIKSLERKGGKLDRIADALYSGGQSIAWYTRYPAGHRPPTSSNRA